MHRLHKEREAGSGDSSWLECFGFGAKEIGVGKLAYRTYLLMALQALQQLTGANYFFYVSLSIELKWLGLVPVIWVGL